MPVNELADNQLLVLDTLVYCFGREGDVRVGETLAELLLDIDSGLKSAMCSGDAKMDALHAEQMSFSDWFSVVDAARRDPEVSGLRVLSYHTDDRGAKMTCLIDDDGRGYFIFAGTGFGEWADDCAAGYLADSEQQERALQWFQQQVSARGFSRVVVSGHSKGGNKAQYIAVRASSSLDRAVSFDGEGFSKAFVEKYASHIEAGARKIIAYALDDDFVNGLLNSVVPRERRIYLRGGHVPTIAAKHAPYSMLVPAPGGHGLVLRSPGAQGELGKTMVALTAFLQERATGDELKRICVFLGTLLENLLSSGKTDEERRANLFALYQGEDMALVVGYFLQFFQSIGRDVTISDVVRYLAPKGTGDEDTVSFSDKLRQRLPKKLRAEHEDRECDEGDARPSPSRNAE